MPGPPSRLRSLLTAPFRALSWPARALRSFLDQEPEDSPTAEVLARSIEQPSLLLEHLEAMRRHLLRAVLVLALTTAASFYFARDILAWLARPLPGGLEALQAIEVTESIGAFMRVSLLSGFVLALPYLSFELFLFVNPGLKRGERRVLLTAIPLSMLLFLAGVGFTYYVMLPAALPFLLNFLGISTQVRPANYIGFVTGLMFWIGIIFQFPLVVYALAAIGLLRSRTLAEGWRIAIIAIAVLAAAITPTIDPVNMGLVMVPMIVLYFLSIGLAALAERSRRRSQTGSTK